MQHLSPRELQTHLSSSDPRPFLLDVREPWEFEICHIAGSVLIPMNKIPTRVSELQRERETVVICHHGIRSRHIALYLEHLGFREVINLEGGVERWADEVDPGMPRY